MTNDKSSLEKPFVRLLFLGNPVTDRRVKNFIGLFLELGFEVEFIFAIPGAGNRETEIGLGIEGVRMKQLLLQYSGGVKMFLQYDRLLKNELQQAKPCDIVFACELYSLRAAAFAKQNGRAKRLFYDARELYTELPTVAGKPLRKLYWKCWERKGLKQTDLVIVTAPDDAEAIKNVHRFLPESILVRNLPKREELKSSNYLREYFSILSEKKVFVYIGGLQRDRGLNKMVNVISSLQDEAAFVMIGGGPIKKELQRTVDQLHLQKNVFFYPLLDSEKAIEILASADIGISLIEQRSKSYELGLPSKVFEYILAGLPVISSPLKHVKDLFDRTEGILFANPADSNELLHASKKAIELSSDSKLRNRIHSEAYKNFTFETDAKPFKTFLTQHPIPDTRTPPQ